MRLFISLLAVAGGAGALLPAAPASPVAAETVLCHGADTDIAIPGGIVLLGEDDTMAPGTPTKVEAFWIDAHEVTNRQFARFVAATGYRTDAEIQGGGAVFTGPIKSDPARPNWWTYRKGADWQHPTGQESSILGKGEMPVVQVTFRDASAYAKWVGREIPDVQHWERAARGLQAKPRKARAWAYDAHGNPIANTWQGHFPEQDAGEDHHAGLAPVGCYQPNGFGLYDMIGNVWEWTSDPLDTTHRSVKGGSFLCAENYCANFRPAAWQAQENDLPTSHIGFRTMRRGAAAAISRPEHRNL